MSDKKITELPVASVLNLSDVSILVSGGTNYQYTFTGLLQLIASGLNVGANISFGTTLPSNATGKNGDVFIKTNSGSFAQKVAGVWTIVYTLPTTGGVTDGTVLYGLGIPAISLGNDNDTYINTGTGVFYKKSTGAWTQVFSMQTGPQGPQGMPGTNGANGTNGFSILSGTSIPSNTNTGVNGDFYLNTISYTLYGPKTAGIWGDGVSLIGLGLEPGGTIGQVLTKASNNDYDLTWTTPAVIDDNIASSTKVYSSQKTSSLISNEASARAAADEDLLEQIEGKQSQLDYTPENINNKNIANGYAGLDGSGKISSILLPSYVDDVLEFSNYNSLPNAGETSKIYVTLNDNKEYRWGGSAYVQLVPSPGSTDSVPEGSSNLYFTNARVAAFGNSNYLQNQNATTQSGSFKISGDGTLGGSIKVGGHAEIGALGTYIRFLSFTSNSNHPLWVNTDGYLQAFSAMNFAGTTVTLDNSFKAGPSGFKLAAKSETDRAAIDTAPPYQFEGTMVYQYNNNKGLYVYKTTTDFNHGDWFKIVTAEEKSFGDIIVSVTDSTGETSNSKVRVNIGGNYYDLLAVKV